MKKNFVLMVTCRNAVVIHAYDSATAPVISEIKGCLEMLDRVVIFADDGVIFDEKKGAKVSTENFQRIFKKREIIREIHDYERKMLEKYNNRY